MKGSGDNMRLFPLPNARRHTYHFLNYAREFRSVYIDTEIDMSAVIRRRNERKAAGMRISYVAFLIEAIARAIRLHPEANVVVKNGFRPKIAHYSNIDAKFTVDKTIDGQRVVMSGLIPNADATPVEEMQKIIEYYRDRDASEISEFANVRKLQSLPAWLGSLGYRLAMGKLGGRPKLQGTFSITSLGHRPIQAFYPIISNTLCFGVGAIEDKPAALEGRIVIRPMMRLGLAFDHRAIDGALAADILGEVKQLLELGRNEVDSKSKEEEVSLVGTSS